MFNELTYTHDYNTRTKNNGLMDIFQSHLD